MFFAGMKHLTKAAYISQKGRVIASASAKSAYHYLTRTAQFSEKKAGESIEFVEHGNMPNWVAGHYENFWKTADQYEREKGRTATTLVIALPNHLSPAQRAELAKNLIESLCDQHQFPYSAAIHCHEGALGGQEQPHLHIMYSERGLDGVERGPQQFFKQWNRKNPSAGGTRKLTADVLGYGRNHVDMFRETVEDEINDYLDIHAPTKTIMLYGEEITVPSRVSRLSTRDYNQQYHTQLEEVPMIPAHLMYMELDHEKFKKRYANDEAKIQQHLNDLKALQVLKAKVQTCREYNRAHLYGQYYVVQMANKKRNDFFKSIQVKRTEVPAQNIRLGIDHQSYETVSMFSAHWLNISKGIYDHEEDRKLRDILAKQEKWQDLKTYRENLTLLTERKDLANQELMKLYTKITHLCILEPINEKNRLIEEAVDQLIVVLKKPVFDRKEKLGHIQRFKSLLATVFDPNDQLLQHRLGLMIDDLVYGEARKLYGLEKPKSLSSNARGNALD